MTSRFFRIPGTAVVHEYLDDEVIIANLDSGIYYSARGVGISIWELLVAGHTQGSAQALLAERYPSASEGLGSALREFVLDACNERLLIEAAAEESTIVIAQQEIHYPQTYQPPVLEKYEEMKDLLLLDPVHEVDEQGWPSRSAP